MAFYDVDNAMTVKLDYDLPPYPTFREGIRRAPRREAHLSQADKALAIRSLEALAKVANGKATKIIIPSELQNLGGVVPSIKELMTDPKDAE